VLTSKTVQSEITCLARWWGCRKTTSKVQNKFQNKKNVQKEKRKKRAFD